jgi:hypothetical protein
MGACLPSGSAGAQSHADVPGGADPDATTATLRSACEKALQWNDQQERLIDALLTLASSERGIERWEPFDLADIAGKVTCGKFRICCTQQEQKSCTGPAPPEACVARAACRSPRSASRTSLTSPNTTDWP